MIKAMRIYTVVFCVLLFLGETAVVLTTDKYWPLSFDDYVAIGVLLASLRSLEHLKGQLLQLGTWAYMSGKLYTMVFVRLDPATVADQPVLALTFLLAEAIIGLLLTCLCIRALTRADQV